MPPIDSPAQPNLTVAPPSVPDPQGVEVVIPLDKREAVQAATPPPPISGGSLLVTRDYRFAVAADPDRDRISIVDLNGQVLAATIALTPGDEPGRLVEDDDGRVHVALRRAGAVVSIDLPSAAIVARRDVCGAPRGIAFEPSTSSLIVACASGQLMSLPAAPSGTPSMRVQLQTDLRDVVVTAKQTFVSSFKRAELLTLGTDGAVAATSVPPDLRVGFPARFGADIADTLTPDFAFRTLRADDGRMFMLHQGARSGEIDLEVKPTAVNGIVNVTGPYGGSGGGFPTCGGVVQSELTVFDAQGARESNARLPGLLPVDAALNPDATQIAVVFAGALDRETPPRTARQTARAERVPGAAGSPASGPLPTMPTVNLNFSVAVFSTDTLTAALTGFSGGECLVPVDHLPSFVAFEPVGVAYANGPWAVQNREPAQLVLFQGASATTTIDLGGDTVADTGHTLFHHDAGGGIACASCHAEGGEDGHVWHFSGSGPRRTQALHVGLEGTAPFHWAGDMAGMSELMEEVLVTRMGGVHESAERGSALEHWLFSLRPPAPVRVADDPAVARGRALFEGRAECASCHTGAKLTNNRNEDVGTGEVLQVPSLVGVGHRAPWMHTGCANSLRDRFDVACGGDKHGKTADLDATQIDDLIAYLESL